MFAPYWLAIDVSSRVWGSVEPLYSDAGAELQVAAVLPRAAAAREHERHVVVHVARRIAQLVRPQDDRVVVDRAVALGDGLQHRDEGRHLRRVPALHLRQVAHAGRVVGAVAVRDVVVNGQLAPARRPATASRPAFTGSMPTVATRVRLHASSCVVNDRMVVDQRLVVLRAPAAAPGLRAPRRGRERPRVELLLQQVEAVELPVELEALGAGQAPAQQLRLGVEVVERRQVGLLARRRLGVGRRRRAHERAEPLLEAGLQLVLVGDALAGQCRTWSRRVEPE